MIKLKIGMMKECKQYQALICMCSVKQENLATLLLLKEKSLKLIDRLKLITGLCLFGLF